jgi:hypothetical protein
LFRIICLSIPKLANNNFLGAIVYFSVAGAWNLFCIAIFFKFKKTDLYQLITNPKHNDHSEMTDDSVVLTESMVSNVQNKKIEKAVPEKMGMLKTIWWVNKETFPVPLCIMLIYI